ALLGAGKTGLLRTPPLVATSRAAASRALAWLQSQMRADGFLGEPAAGNSVVAHAMCCLVLMVGNRLGGQEPPNEPLPRLSALRLPAGRSARRPGGATGAGEATYVAFLACYPEAAHRGLQIDLHPTVYHGDFGPSHLPGAEAEVLLRFGHTPKNDGRLASLA